MMWCFPDDRSEPVISAKDQIHSAHRECHLRLLKTAIVFFMSRGVDRLREKYDARELPEPFPRFLNRCPIWEIERYQVCFLDGGRGAPQACDTVETLAALGVKASSRWACSARSTDGLSIGEIVTPEKAFVEEGTSLHYYESIEYAAPDSQLLQTAAAELRTKTYPIVSTDTVYRQTFYKEQLWREKGAVGVDDEIRSCG